MSIPLNLLKHVSNERLMNYLMDNGWTEKPIKRHEVLEFVSSSGHSVVIPAVEHLVDYERIMMLAVSDVAKVECRSIEDVFADMLPSPAVKLAEVTDLAERLAILTDKYSNDDILQPVSDLLSEIVCKIEEEINDVESSI